MFIGHTAVGFALKRLAPRAPLGVLLVAVNWADILWTLFLLLGWEHARIVPGDTNWAPFSLYDYPWSHSLLALAVWATILALLYRAVRKDKAAAAAIWIGVISHWLLDWISHRPDMPLYPGGPKFGLGLWNSLLWTYVVELAIFFTGVSIYARATKPRDRIGRHGFWIYVAFLLFIYLADRFSGPPKSMREVAWTGLIGVAVLVAWADWFDHHRLAVVAGTNAPAVP